MADQRLEGAAVAGRADDRVGLDTASAGEDDPRGVERLDRCDDLDRPSLTAAITSLSTIEGAVPSRRRRVINPSSGTGRPYSLTPPKSWRLPKRANAFPNRVGK